MKRILPLVLSVTLVTACNAPSIEKSSSAAPTPATDTGAQNSGDATAAIDDNQLIAYRWLLDNATDNHGQRIDALFVREDHPITLVFKDGELSVNNTCNRMGAGYTLEGSTLSIAPMISTQMACPETGVMVQEAAIGSGLEGILTIRWLDASRLELVTLAGNVLRFRSAPLADDLAEGSMPINLEHAHAD